MYFYPKQISQEALDALQAVGLELKGGEMVIPDSDVTQNSEFSVTLRGVTLSKQVLRFGGHEDPPQVYSSLHRGMVDTGRDLDQCPTCGYWLTDKPSPSDEQQHLRQCHPQYEWQLA